MTIINDNQIGGVTAEDSGTLESIELALTSTDSMAESDSNATVNSVYPTMDPQTHLVPGKQAFWTKSD